MTFATRSLPRVRISNRHSASSHRWRTILKAFVGGLAAVVVVLVTISATVMGTARLIAVSRGAPLHARPALALAAPSNRLALAALPADDIAPQPVIAAVAPQVETEPASDARAPQTGDAPAPLATASSETPESSVADPESTASLGPESPEPAPVQVALAGPAASLSTLDAAPPMPQARPRFAALPPAGDLGIEPDQDAHPPRTAIYDITAQTVYLPSGERLEAHSGLGELMDDPRYVRRKNRGATPPNIYRLRLRESLFHGVQAIRLTPIRQEDMFGRDGILAHSYLLGPNGQSNGCVSLKDYDRFLSAYLRGEFDRMIVVARLAKPPTFARPNIRSAANTF